MKIQVLPQNLINQIAAGEVVVNMASVVKELVENAIDAGASRIEIELANDMRDVTIADDGCGMDRDDAELALQRHATSKIRTTEDLFHIATRGFRGEAIPSIASVSRLEIQTRPHDQVAGTRVVVEGGAIERIEGAGCPAGTRILIRDLFYNTPARLKFLKGKVAEMNAVMRTVVRQALAAYEIGFRVMRDGEPHLELAAGQSLAERFLAIAGAKIDSGLLELEFLRTSSDDPPIRVYGYLAQPQSSRGDRSSQYLFVNGRPFSSKTLSSSIEQACRGFISIGRFPIFCVFAEVEPGEVDINVHPTKEEVRFRNERAVAGACYHAARLALEAHGYVPEMKMPVEDASSSPSVGESRPTPGITPSNNIFESPQALVNRAFDRKRARELQTDWTALAAKMEPSQPVGRAFSPALDSAVERATETPMPTSGGNKIVRAPEYAAPGERPEPDFWQQPFDPESLGQIALTYIVVRFGEDILLIDQHAAHERLRYIELQNRPSQVASQSLLVPETFEVPADQTATMEAMIEPLKELGFEVEPFGGRTYAIAGVPGDLANVSATALITDLLDEFEDQPKLNRVEDLRQRILIRAACHSSIRAGHRLSQEEMDELLVLMRRYQLSFTCPHGRPTVIRLSKHELDKQFKRLG